MTWQVLRTKRHIGVLRGLCKNHIEALLASLALLLFFAVSFVSGSVPLAAALCCGVAAVALLCVFPKAIIYSLVIYSFVVKYLVGDLGVSSIANYVCDGLLVMGLFFAVIKPQEGYAQTKAFRLVGKLVGAFWLVATLSAVFNGVSPLLYVWANRNTLRVFGMLYCCVRMFGRKDVHNLIAILYAVFFLNILVCTWQYFVLGTGQDNTNGLFGTGSGGNAMMNVMMVAVAALSLFGFAAKRFTIGRVLFVLAACCYLAGIAELKVFYVELALIIGLIFLLEKPSFKTLAIVVLSGAALIVGLQVLYAFNPAFAGYFDLQSIIESSSEGGYSNEGNLNRLTAVTTLQDMFMGDMVSKFLGLGFGAGQYTQFFESPLYAIWGETLNWNWFTDAAIYLETGWPGLAAYCLVFAVIALFSIFMRNKAGEDSWVAKASAAFAVLCFVLIVYNCTLTVDPGCYFVGMFLSFPFIFWQGADERVPSEPVVKPIFSVLRPLSVSHA